MPDLPQYAKVLKGYNRILNQRNNLLRDIASHPFLLDTLELDVSAGGIRLLYRRYAGQYIHKRGRIAAEIYRDPVVRQGGTGLAYRPPHIGCGGGKETPSGRASPRP